MDGLSGAQRRDALVKIAAVCTLRSGVSTTHYSEEEVAKKAGFGSAMAMHIQLEKWNLPNPIVYGTSTVHVGEKRPEDKRKRAARRGTTEVQHLPNAGGSVGLFAPVIARLDDLFSSLSALEEAYKDERFEAVERYQHAAITDDEVAPGNDVVLPLGAKQSPSRILTELIAAYVIADQPVDALVDALHPEPGNIDRAKLGEKVEKLQLLAGHVAKLVRGGTIRRGHHTEELSSREQEAVRFYANQLHTGVAEEEIRRTLHKWGFKRSDIPRIKNLGQNFLY
jgi:hypothetical protein